MDARTLIMRTVYPNGLNDKVKTPTIFNLHIAPDTSSILQQILVHNVEFVSPQSLILKMVHTQRLMLSTEIRCLSGQVTESSGDTMMN